MSPQLADGTASEDEAADAVHELKKWDPVDVFLYRNGTKLTDRKPQQGWLMCDPQVMKGRKKSRYSTRARYCYEIILDIQGKVPHVPPSHVPHVPHIDMSLI